jgi:single-stranded DNA-binding protein
MAKTLFTGRLTADAEVKAKETGFATFTLAENVGTGDNQRTNFFKCKGNFSDAQLKYLTKGKSLDVIGELNIEVNEVGDKKYYNTEVSIIHFSFTQLPKKEETETK